MSLTAASTPALAQVDEPPDALSPLYDRPIARSAQALVPYDSLYTGGRVGLLRPDGSLTRRRPGRNPGPPSVVRAPGGYLAAWVDFPGGFVNSALLDENGTFGAPVRLTGDEYPSSVTIARTAAGETVLARMVDEGHGGPFVDVDRFRSDGTPAAETQFFSAEGDSLHLLARADGEVWIIEESSDTSGSDPVIVRRVSAARATLERLVVGRPEVDRPERDASLSVAAMADDGRGGLFLLLSERLAPEGVDISGAGVRVAHVSGDGTVRRRRVARIIAPGDAALADGGLVVQRGRARIVYHAYDRVGGRRVGGVFTRHFSCAGRLGKRRRLAIRGFVEDVVTQPGSGAVRILRRRRGLRIHRLARRRQLGRGRIVTRSRRTTSGRFAFDRGGRAYVAWGRLDPSACPATDGSSGSSVFARVVSRRDTGSVHLLARCRLRSSF